MKKFHIQKKHKRQTKKNSIFCSHKKLHKQTKRGQYFRPKKHKKLHKQTKKKQRFFICPKKHKKLHKQTYA